MKNTKHTKGPWITDLITNENGPMIWKNNKQIAVVIKGRQGEANAHLIAASPDLLEALERAYSLLVEEFASADEVEPYKGVIEACEIAIAKAKGV